MVKKMVKKIYGIIGDPVAHSLSPVMQNAAFEELGMSEGKEAAVYLAFQVSRDELGDALRGAKSLGFSGLNVTIPLKEKALSFVDAEEVAKKIGAVNTIDFGGGVAGGAARGRGYNTDGIGAKRVLEEEEGVGEIKGKRVLILGAGGAARAISFYLAAAGGEVTIANRTRERAAELASNLNLNLRNARARALGLGTAELKKQLKEADILINATSVGMSPNENATLVTAEMMHSDLAVFDIVYNPLQTRLLKEANLAGVKTVVDGVKMLVYQGAASFRIWTGQEPPVEVMENAVRNALERRT